MSGLLPCPFCGAAQETDPAIENGVSLYVSCKSRYWHVHCHGCGATTEGHEESKEQARSRWNKRAHCRDAVIEECAKVAEDQRADDWFEVGKVAVATGKRIAAAIRSLKQPAGGA